VCLLDEYLQAPLWGTDQTRLAQLTEYILTDSLHNCSHQPNEQRHSVVQHTSIYTLHQDNAARGTHRVSRRTWARGSKN